MTRNKFPTGIESLRILLVEEIAIAKEIQQQRLKRLAELERFPDNPRFDKERQQVSRDIASLQIAVIETLKEAINPPLVRRKRPAVDQSVHQTTGNPNDSAAHNDEIDTGG